MTEHFSFEELTCTNFTKFKTLNTEYALLNKERVLALAQFAESVRAVLGAAMTVTSGVRCARLNAAVGGAPGSQHTACEALDFVCHALTPAQAYEKIKNSALVFGQLILERINNKEWVHISIGTQREVLEIKR